jgi:molybdopterin-guanine dinucleotide biosynthesis protein MobB
MRRINPPLLAIVGYSNSGKTTLMERLIATLSVQGLRIATIKHSHHQPEMDVPGKDSWRHKQAGAVASLLVGPERMLMVADINVPMSPQELAAAMFPNADLVLVEGYASMPCPKIEVVRSARCIDLRCDMSDLLAVATDIDALDVSVPVLDLNDSDAITAFILDWLKQEYGHG